MLSDEQYETLSRTRLFEEGSINDAYAAYIDATQQLARVVLGHVIEEHTPHTTDKDIFRDTVEFLKMLNVSLPRLWASKAMKALKEEMGVEPDGTLEWLENV